MQFENQKDNEQFFIFPIKKIDVLRVKLIFKKNSDARHRNAYLARVKTGNPTMVGQNVRLLTSYHAAGTLLAVYQQNIILKKLGIYTLFY